MTNVVQLINGDYSVSAWYQYDAAGRLWKKGYGNGDVVTHGYDIESRLLSLGITNSTTPVTRFDYGWDAGGNILAITNNSTNVTFYGYDNVGQLTNEIAFTIGLAGSTTNGWVYDEAGNWLNVNTTNKWVYNPDNELIGRTGTNDNTWSVTVTGAVEPGANSNKWYNTWAECRGVSARVSTNDGTFSLPDVPVYAGTNELVVRVTDVSGNTSQQTRTVVKECADCLEQFYYDGNGNLTNWVHGTTNWVYEWDWADRMTKASSNGVVMLENWYDASSRRVAKKEYSAQFTNYVSIQYMFDGWNIQAVLNHLGDPREMFTRGLGLAGDIGTLVAVTRIGAPQPTAYYTHHNHRGDVIATRNGATTTGTYDYTAFGSLKAQSGTDVCRFQFSSKERDASTGFSYYGYRFYAPEWQRWVNGDPIGEFAGLNLYSFVFNTPINSVDPWGLDCWSDFEACMSPEALCQAAMNPLAILGASLGVASEPSVGPKGGKRPIFRGGRLASYPRAAIGRAAGGFGLGVLAGILAKEAECYGALLGCLSVNASPAPTAPAPYVPPYSGGHVNLPPVIVF
jgi:RHS repeat-associated protein